MVTILARSRWTSTAAKGTPFRWARVRGIVCHYPAMGKSVGVLTAAQEASRLRGWRNYHVGTLGWSDIGYNYAIGQSGRVYSLRGDRVAAHAVGHNSRTVGVLFIVGDNEALTSAAQASFRALRATLRKRGCGSGLWGHTEMSGNSTRCPGPYIMADIRSGVLKSAATAAPPFPLPRRPGRMFYYGPAGGPQTSVSGMGLNTAVPADVVKVGGRWRSNGLAKWQQRMIDRGWTELVRAGGADGRYGKTTEKVVRQFQALIGEKVDGKLGPSTWAAAWTAPVR